MLDQNIILAGAIIFGVLIALLIAMLATYTFFLRRERYSERLRADLAKPDKLVEEAQTRSIKILEDAHRKARDILSLAENIIRTDEEVLKNETEKVAGVFTGSFEASLNAIKLEAEKTLTNLPLEIKDLIIKSFSHYQKTLDEMVRQSNLALEKAISEATKKVSLELERAKAKKVRDLDRQAASIVKEVNLKVLGKSLDGVEQEKMVIKALEEAKRQGMFE